MVELATSAWLFLLGMAKRSYWLVPAFLLDPFDLYDRYLVQEFGWEVTIPDFYFPLALGVLLLWAAILTFHAQRATSLGAIRFDIMDCAVELPSYNRARPTQPFDMAEITLEGQLINHASGPATLERLAMLLKVRSWGRWQTVATAEPIHKKSSIGANRDISYETITVFPRSKSREITKLVGYFTLPEDCDPAGRFRVDVVLNSILFARPSVTSRILTFKDEIEPALAFRARAIERGLLPPEKEKAEVS